MSSSEGWSAQLEAWIESLSPEKARDFLASPVEVEVCGSAPLQNAPLFRQKNPLTLRAMSRINTIANS